MPSLARYLSIVLINHIIFSETFTAAFTCVFFECKGYVANYAYAPIGTQVTQPMHLHLLWCLGLVAFLELLSTERYRRTAKHAFFDGPNFDRLLGISWLVFLTIHCRGGHGSRFWNLGWVGSKNFWPGLGSTHQWVGIRGSEFSSDGSELSQSDTISCLNWVTTINLPLIYMYHVKALLSFLLKPLKQLIESNL